MHKNRMEAFSDGVIAILITIMVLELKAPKGHHDVLALQPLFPAFLSYVISFVFLGIYWNNHHHLLQAAERISGGVLWANLYLLFWLSLLPFSTSWMAESCFEAVPVALYGLNLLLAGTAYFILTFVLKRRNGAGSKLARAVGNDFKGKVSALTYALSLPLAFVHPWIALGLYIAVAILWLVPDSRIERVLE